MAQYDPTKVIATIHDGFVITGWAEDTMITVSRMEDKRSVHVGAQGNVTFMKNANDVAEITFNLAANSPANVKLMTLYNQDEPFGFGMLDTNYDGDVGGSATECVVQNLPDDEKSAELSEKEWTLLAADYEKVIETVEGVIG